MASNEGQNEHRRDFQTRFNINVRKEAQSKLSKQSKKQTKVAFFTLVHFSKIFITTIRILRTLSKQMHEVDNRVAGIEDFVDTIRADVGDLKELGRDLVLNSSRNRQSLIATVVYMGRLRQELFAYHHETIQVKI